MASPKNARVSYYKEQKDADFKLISYNDTLKIYRVRNTLEKSKTLSKEEFDYLNCERIKKHQFKELLNAYFNSCKDSWEYLGVNYRKLDNFGSGDISWESVPQHQITVPETSYGFWYKIVWHQGNVYHALDNGNYFPQIPLFDIKTNKAVKWTNVKNLAPVFNVDDKVII